MIPPHHGCPRSTPLRALNPQVFELGHVGPLEAELHGPAGRLVPAVFSPEVFANVVGKDLGHVRSLGRVRVAQAGRKVPGRPARVLVAQVAGGEVTPLVDAGAGNAVLDEVRWVGGGDLGSGSSHSGGGQGQNSSEELHGGGWDRRDLVEGGIASVIGEAERSRAVVATVGEDGGKSEGRLEGTERMLIYCEQPMGVYAVFAHISPVPK